MSPSPQDQVDPVDPESRSSYLDEGSNVEAAERKQTSVDNPIVGAIAFGLGSPIRVSIGASIRGNNVHEEALTVLYGGLVIGFICGVLGAGLIISKPKNEQIYNVLLQWCAILLTPLLGQRMNGYDSATWTRVITDQLVGSCIIIGGVCVLICCYVFSSAFLNSSENNSSLIPRISSALSRNTGFELEFALVPVTGVAQFDIASAGQVEMVELGDVATLDAVGVAVEYAEELDNMAVANAV